MTGLPRRYAEYLDPILHKMGRERRKADGEPEPWDPDFVPAPPKDPSQEVMPGDLGRFAKSLADIVRDIRFASGRPLRGVALNASMSKFTLSRLERGQRAMTVDELARIAFSLDRHVEDLVEQAVAKLR